MRRVCQWLWNHSERCSRWATLSRHLVLLVPKQPVLDWLWSIDSGMKKTHII